MMHVYVYIGGNRKFEMQTHTTKVHFLFGKIFQYKEFATLPTPLNLPMCIFTPLTENIFQSALSNLIKIRLDISVTLRFSPFSYDWIVDERRETEISSLILIRLFVKLTRFNAFIYIVYIFSGGSRISEKGGPVLLFFFYFFFYFFFFFAFH